MKKRYLILIIFIAILIGKILLGFGLFELNKIYDITGKWGITGDIIGYGVYNSDSYEDFISNMQDVYIKEKEKGKEVYFVFGDDKEVEIVNYDEFIQGSINIVSGDVTSNLNINEDQYVSRKIKPKDNRVSFLINGEKYDFKIKPDEKIYLIISDDAE